MNDRSDLEFRVTDWLRAAGPARAPDRVLVSALSRVAGVGQSRPFGGRRFDDWIGASPRLRWALILVVLAALLGTVAGAGAFLRREARNAAPIGSGGWIAYSQHSGAAGDDARNGEMDLYLVRAGTAPLKIAGSGGETGAAGMRAVCPAFSPDGTRLAFAESGNPGTVVNNSHVWTTRAVLVITLDAAGHIKAPTVRIPVLGTGGDPCPVWTPDGGSLVFLTGAAGYFVTGATGHLAVASATDGATIVPIAGTDTLVEVSTFAVSPNGRTIATVDQSGISLMAIGGGAPRRLVDSANQGNIVAGNIAWSPDGTRLLAAIATPPSAQGVPADPSIQVVSLDGTSAAIGNGYSPVWSPDGERIAFENGSGTEIVVANPDGSAPHVIALASVVLPGAFPIHSTYSGIAWSPDGSQLLFASDQGLISLSAAGDPAAQLLVTTSDPGYGGISQTGFAWQQVNR